MDKEILRKERANVVLVLVLSAIMVLIAATLLFSYLNNVADMIELGKQNVELQNTIDYYDAYTNYLLTH